MLYKRIKVKEVREVGSIIFKCTVRAWIDELPTPQQCISFSFGLTWIQFLWLCRLFWRKTHLQQCVQSWLGAPVLSWWLFYILFLKATPDNVLR